MDAGILKIFGEFGVLALLLVFLLLSIGYMVRWLANKAVLPLVESGIKYMQYQTEATQKNLDSIEKSTVSIAAIEKLEGDIRTALKTMMALHNDEDSAFSTVHTNNAIRLLAKTLLKMAEATHVDVKELVDGIDKTLSKQKS